MTKEYVMEATWEEFAAGIGYQLPQNDANFFRIHLQHKPMSKDKMATSTSPGVYFVVVPMTSSQLMIS